MRLRKANKNDCKLIFNWANQKEVRLNSINKNKSLAMECYQYEKRPLPHPRSPEALMVLAQSRGLAIGEKYAEAFCIIRMKLK